MKIIKDRTVQNQGFSVFIVFFITIDQGLFSKSRKILDNQGLLATLLDVHFSSVAMMKNFGSNATFTYLFIKLNKNQL